MFQNYIFKSELAGVNSQGVFSIIHFIASGSDHIKHYRSDNFPVGNN